VSDVWSARGVVGGTVVGTWERPEVGGLRWEAIKVLRVLKVLEKLETFRPTARRGRSWAGPDWRELHRGSGW
jgi:hypothetical protein